MENIIIIIVDAFRCQNLSLFGYGKETDKNLKEIAKESVFFRQYFSTSNATAPALTSLFTGNYPNTHGIIHQLPYTKEEEITKLSEKKFWLPTYLKEKGYKTIAIDWIGLWFKEGFDVYEEREKRKGSKFLNIPLIKRFLLGMPSWMYKLGKKIIKKRSTPGFPPASETMGVAISEIKSAEKPFFLFMHFWDTHFPFPTTEYKAEGKKDIDLILEGIKNPYMKDYAKKRVADINLDSSEDIVNKYDVALKNIDEQIGRLCRFLKEENLWKDTIFIVLGDHGDRLVEPGNWFSHAGLHDNLVHVPLLIHLPKAKAKETSEFAQTVDIPETILDYLKLNGKEKMDGKSMMDLIKKDKAIRDKVFLWDGLSEDIRAVRTKNKKLIISKDASCNLCKSKHTERIEEYNLLQDPEEKKNIFEGGSELVSSLM